MAADDVAETEKLTLALQYTIAQRERLWSVLRILRDMMGANGKIDFTKIISALIDSPSERLQDVFALLVSGGKRGGYFVEFGACDGQAMSNTLTLERLFGWRGILAEPDPYWKAVLAANRKAILDVRCVSSRSGEMISFFQSDRPGNSSLDEQHPYIGEIQDRVFVETVSLLDLLDDHKAPKFIDFLSVDVEGHEKEVFEHFDFKRYKFGFICVEEHEQVPAERSVQPILERAGYRPILLRNPGRPLPMQVTGIDKFFVPAGHFAEKWVSEFY